MPNFHYSLMRMTHILNYFQFNFVWNVSFQQLATTPAVQKRHRTDRGTLLGGRARRGLRGRDDVVRDGAHRVGPRLGGPRGPTPELAAAAAEREDEQRQDRRPWALLPAQPRSACQR